MAMIGGIRFGCFFSGGKGTIFHDESFCDILAESFSRKLGTDFALLPAVNEKDENSNLKIKNIMKSIKPLADRVLVKPAEAEQKTAGGIIIPDTAKEKPQQGTVIAVGPGKKDEPMTVKVKDTVLYGKYSGTEIQLDGETYLIMKESDIYAICK